MNKFVQYSGLTVGVLVASYAALGYFAVPYASKWVLEKTISQKIQHPVLVEKISFNPWTLALHIENVQIQNAERKDDIVSIGDVYLNLSHASILEKAIIVEALHVRNVRGFFTLSRKNLKELKKYQRTSTQRTSSTQNLPFAFSDIQLENINLTFINQELGIHETIEQLQLSLPYFGNIANHSHTTTRPSLSLLYNGNKISSQGKITPFQDTQQARMIVQIPRLDLVPLLKIIPRFRSPVLQVNKGTLSTTLHITFRQESDQTPMAFFLSGQAKLRDIRITQKINQRFIKLLTLKNATLDLEKWDLIQHEFALNQLYVNQLQMHAQNQQGIMTFLQRDDLRTDSMPTLPSIRQNNMLSNYQWYIKNAQIKNSQITWRDPHVTPSSYIVLKNLNSTVENLSSRPQDPAGTVSLTARFLDGRIALKGNVAMGQPSIFASLTAQKLSTKQIEGYLKKFTGLDIVGNTTFSLQVHHQPQNSSVRGNLSLDHWTVKEQLHTLFSIQNANAHIQSIDYLNRKIQLDTLLINALTLNLKEDQNGFNLQKAFTFDHSRKPNDVAQPRQHTGSQPWQWDLHHFRLQNFHATYQNTVVQPNTYLTLQKGRILAENLSSRSEQMSQLQIKATVDKAPISIQAQTRLSPFEIHGTVHLQNLALQSLEGLMHQYWPYAIKNGTITLQGKGYYKQNGTQNQVQWQGDASTKALRIVDAKEKTLFTLDAGNLNQLQFQSSQPFSFHLARAELRNPGIALTEQLQQVNEVANLVGALTGKTKLSEQLNRLTQKTKKTIVLEDIHLQDQQLRSNKVAPDSTRGRILAFINTLLANSKQRE